MDTSLLQARAQSAWEKKHREVLIQKEKKDRTIIDDRLLTHNELGVTQEKRSPRLIVSLTSFPPRMSTIYYCLYTLLTQSVKPDMLILWLANEQFPNKEKDIPQKVLDMQKLGLTIRWTKDIKSYKKLIPTLKEYPNDIIVTADDDIYYSESWLKKLYEAYLNDNKNILCHRAHKIKFDKEENILPYTSWSMCIDDNSNSLLNFCTTGGGILYPPHILYKDVLNEELFMKLCPHADDIWFWAMAVMNGTKIKVVDEAIHKISEIYIENNICLYETNIVENDNQLKKVIEYYPQILKILKEVKNA